LAIHTKTVLGRVCEVTTKRRTKGDWRAYGTAFGQPINVKGPTEEMALENWQWVAERMTDYGSAPFTSGQKPEKVCTQGRNYSLLGRTKPKE